ncbi:MAG: hypothetical protein ACKVHT_00995 [Flavobacteriales bacterium]|jgi:hypothetical protein|tara:strand:- start:4049 stop:4471 length:423 start_codon:yes stop_codon:yes gene_type:complete
MKIKYLIIFLFLLTNCSSDLEYLEKFKGYNSNPRVVETKTFILEKGGNIEKERNNAPKNICMPYFPTNNRYVIMKPLFKKDGKSYLLDLKTKEVIDAIKMPRGFSKFEIFDVTKNHLWASHHIQNKNQEEVQIIKLEIEN